MTTVNNSNVSPPSSKDEDSKEKGFFNRLLPGGKTPWDWLQLIGVLLIPLVIFLATMRFNQQQADLAQQQHENDQKIAIDQQRQAIFVTYLDDMRDLLLNRGLLTSKPDDEIRVIARTETLSAMRQLDGKRNSFLVQFLRDAHLIGLSNSDILNFENADMSSSDFSGADLSFVDLMAANLTNADLRGAKLWSANLHGAILSGTDLWKTDLSFADLSSANLSEAFLVKAYIWSADLKGALLTHARLYGDLRSANLSNANLNHTNLSGDILSFADLRGADLTSSDLSCSNQGSLGIVCTNLSKTNLQGANLSGANLSKVSDLTQQQLDQVYSCRDAILDPGLTCHHNK